MLVTVTDAQPDWSRPCRTLVTCSSFTDRARRVVVLAQEEARLLDHNYIGTEHILLGLIHEGEGVAARALESLDISLEAVHAQVVEIVGHGGTAPSGHIPFTPRAKKVLELGLHEALQLGHNYIGTEHILLGLIREGEGVAAQTLIRFGADLDPVRRAVIALIGGDASIAGSAVESSVAPSRGIRPARCGFCDVASPACGPLFTGSSGALICQRCARTAAGEELPRAVTRGRMETSDVLSALVNTAVSIEDLAARHEPTGPPPDDEDAARQAIEDAFVHAMEVGADGRSLINVEDGAALADCAEQVRARVGAIVEQVEQVIEHIKFLDAATAIVWQTTLQNGRPPAPWLVRRECRAVFVDGRWKVSRETICDLWKPLGIQCPPRALTLTDTTAQIARCVPSHDRAGARELCNWCPSVTTDGVVSSASDPDIDHGHRRSIRFRRKLVAEDLGEEWVHDRVQTFVGEAFEVLLGLPDVDVAQPAFGTLDARWLIMPFGGSLPRPCLMRW